MPRAFTLQKISTRKAQHLRNQRGYMLMTIMLGLALITMAMLAALPDIMQQIRRDREQELIHRGTAYMRAIKSFNRTMGRYPSSIEELENTNNFHFLRRHYTDPMSRDPVTGKEKEFKLLHQSDITWSSAPPVAPEQSDSAEQDGSEESVSEAKTAGASNQNSANGNPGASSPDNSRALGRSNSPNSLSSNSNPSASSGLGDNPPTFGEGPILGVASTSKAKTIRVFFNKNHYNDWSFIYLQQLDRGGLLRGPVNPVAPTADLNGLTPLPSGAGAQGQGAAGPGQGLGQGPMPNTGQPPIVPQPPQNQGQPPQQ